METPLQHAEPEGGDSIIDLTTPEGEVRLADPEEGAAKDKDKKREEPARDEPVVIAREEDVEDDPDVPRRRGEDNEEYSRRVRGRINREIALRKRVERRADEQTAVNEELRERLAKIERRQT